VQNFELISLTVPESENASIVMTTFTGISQYISIKYQKIKQGLAVVTD